MNSKSMKLAAGLFGIAAAGALGIAARAQHGDEAGRNHDAVARAFAAWAEGTGSPFDLLAEGAVWTIAGTSLAAGTYSGKADFMERVIGPFGARLAAPLVPAVRHLYADDDTVIAHFDAAGTARDGLPYANSYVWIMRFEKGRIVEVFAWYDSKAFDELWTRVAPA